MKGHQFPAPAKKASRPASDPGEKPSRPERPRWGRNSEDKPSRPERPRRDRGSDNKPSRPERPRRGGDYEETPSRPESRREKPGDNFPAPAARKSGPGFSGPGRSEPERPEEDASLILPGLKAVRELLESEPAKIDTVFVLKGRRDQASDRILDLCREHGVRFSLADEAVLNKHYRGRHQGVVARLYEAGFVDWPDLLAQAANAPLPLILALDQVQDPGNAGTLARTLYSLGGAGLLVPRHNGVYLGAAAKKAAAGALERLPVARVVNLGQALDAAEKAGFTLYGASAFKPEENSRSIFELKPEFPAVLVLGSEEDGLRQGVAKRLKLIHVPMLRDFDSLNVAQAGAILLAMFSQAPHLR